MKINNKRIIVIITLVAIIASVMAVSVCGEDGVFDLWTEMGDTNWYNDLGYIEKVSNGDDIMWCHLWCQAFPNEKKFEATVGVSMVKNNVDVTYYKDFLARFENANGDFKVVTSCGNITSVENVNYLSTNAISNINQGYLLYDVYLNQYYTNGIIKVKNSDYTTVTKSHFLSFGRE